MATSMMDHSRIVYDPPRGEITLEGINCGSLQRIAAAAEAMAKNHVALLSDLDWHKRRYAETKAERDHLKRQVAGLRGTISRMKRQAAERETR